MAIALVGAVQNNADSATGWSNGGVETEVFYQGAGAIGSKAGTGTTRYIHTGTARNFSSGGANEGDHIIVILASLTPGKLDTLANGGLRLIAGTSATVYGEWFVDGSDTKPATTLFLPYIRDPASDFDAVTAGLTLTGNPAQLSAADAFGGGFDSTSGIMGNFNNALVDQITIGTGLRGTGVGGDLAEWITADEGTVGNRYGWLTTREGVVYFQGKMYFGSSGASYAFADTDKIIIFPDVQVASDFFEIIVENASSDVEFDGFTIQAAGTPKVALTYISGTWDILNSTIDGARVITGGSGFTIDGTKVTNSGQIDLNGMTLTESTVTNSTDTSAAVLVNGVSDLTNVSGVNFVNNTNGHSIQITAPGVYTFDALTFSGGGLAGTSTADVENTSLGLVTINIINGGSTPTITNTGVGSTTDVNNTVTVSVTVTDISGTPIAGARVLLEAAAGGDLAVGTDILSGTTNGSGVIEDIGFNFTNNQPVTGRARSASSPPYYKNGPIAGTITSGGFATNTILISDQ